MFPSSEIADFYAGRSVFITGATGFMGKVLVEKLLRSCPDIECLYLLIRSNKGKCVSVRLQELMNNQMFDPLKEQQPHAMEKIVPIAGDVTLPNFGMSPSDQQTILENVSVVFNSAATIKFDEDLKTAMEMNVKGPRHLLELCRQMKRLEAFVHVSTAFSNLDRKEIQEEVYPCKYDPVKLIDLLDSLDDDAIRNLTPQLIGHYPNTYTFTKGLAEYLLEKECGTVPLAIVRPSIVTAALKEPVPGWVDNLNGATGCVCGFGKGFLRIMKVDTELISDIIPVDFPINLMIAVAWYTATHKPNEIAVYACTTGHRNPLTWGQLREWGMKAWFTYPTKEMLWYPSCYLTPNDLWAKLNEALFHHIPAYALDLFSVLTNKRRRWVRMYEKAKRATACLDFFTTHHWQFISHNPIRLLDSMTDQDRQIFYFDVRNISWKDYFVTYVLGARRFILKDDLSSMSLAKANLVRLYRIRLLFRAFLILMFVISLRTFKTIYGRKTSLVHRLI